MAEVDRYAARQRYLQRALEVAAVVAGITAALALVVPEDVAEVAAGVTVAILVVTPVARTVWLAIRWARKGDWRFCAAAVAVVAIVACGTLLAAA